MTKDFLDKIVAASRRMDSRKNRVEKDDYCNYITDYEEFHSEILRRYEVNETFTEIQAQEFLKFFEKEWKMRFLALYTDDIPSFHDQILGSGWAISKDCGVIQLPKILIQPTWIIHEITHAIIHAWCYHRPKHQKFEAEHGPVFQGLLALNYSLWYVDLEWKDLTKEMREWNLIPISDIMIAKIERHR